MNGSPRRDAKHLRRLPRRAGPRQSRCTMPSDEDQELFEQIADRIRSHPEEFEAAGQLLDRDYGREAVLKRDKEKADRDIADGWPPEKAREANRMTRVCVATADLLNDPPDFGSLRRDERVLKARLILVLTWIVTDPDADRCDFEITDLQEWPWGDEVLHRESAKAWVLQYRPDQWCRLVRQAIKVLPDSKKKGKIGRPRLSDSEAQRRQQLVADWNRAKGAGEKMKTFCADRGHDLKDVELAVNWLSKRRSRGFMNK